MSDPKRLFPAGERWRVVESEPTWVNLVRWDKDYVEWSALISNMDAIVFPCGAMEPWQAKP